MRLFLLYYIAWIFCFSAGDAKAVQPFTSNQQLVTSSIHRLSVKNNIIAPLRHQLHAQLLLAQDWVEDDDCHEELVRKLKTGIEFFDISHLFSIRIPDQLYLTSYFYSKKFIISVIYLQHRTLRI